MILWQIAYFSYAVVYFITLTEQVVEQFNVDL